MNCPLCQSESHVTHTTPVAGSTRRRRECDVCKHRWTTLEVTERAYKRVQRVEQVVAELATED